MTTPTAIDRACADLAILAELTGHQLFTDLAQDLRKWPQEAGVLVSMMRIVDKSPADRGWGSGRVPFRSARLEMRAAMLMAADAMAQCMQ